MIVTVNGDPREVTPPATLLDLLDLAGPAPTPRGIAVAVDGDAWSPAAEHATTDGRRGRPGRDRHGGAGWLSRRHAARRSTIAGTRPSARG